MRREEFARGDAEKKKKKRKGMLTRRRGDAEKKKKKKRKGMLTRSRGDAEKKRYGWDGCDGWDGYRPHPEFSVDRGRCSRACLPWDRGRPAQWREVKESCSFAPSVNVAAYS